MKFIKKININLLWIAPELEIPTIFTCSCCCILYWSILDINIGKNYRIEITDKFHNIPFTK